MQCECLLLFWFWRWRKSFENQKDLGHSWPKIKYTGRNRYKMFTFEVIQLRNTLFWNYDLASWGAQATIGRHLKQLHKINFLFVSCRHDVVMTTREYARGRRCIPRCIPCAFALWGRRIFPPCQYFSRHVNICFVRPPEFHIKEQIMLVNKEVAARWFIKL